MGKLIGYRYRLIRSMKRRKKIKLPRPTAWAVRHIKFRPEHARTQCVYYYHFFN